MKPIHLIVAVDEANGFAKDNTIPWTLKKDLRHFKKITSDAPAGKQNAVIMGRVTFEQMGMVLLPNRTNYILSALPGYTPSLEKALEACEKDSNVHEIFIIGGEKVYQEAMALDRVANIYKTVVQGTYACDRFFPAIPVDYTLLDERQETEEEYSFKFQLWRKAPHVPKPVLGTRGALEPEK